MDKVTDPNKHLEKLRAQVNYVIAFAGMAPADAVDLAEQVKALDEWLSDPAGYLPREWSHGLDAVVLFARKAAAMTPGVSSELLTTQLSMLIDEAKQALGQ